MRYVVAVVVGLMATNAGAQTRQDKADTAFGIDHAVKAPMAYVMCSAYYSALASYHVANRSGPPLAQDAKIQAEKFKVFVGAAHAYMKDRARGEAMKQMADELAAAAVERITVPGEMDKMTAKMSASCATIGEIVDAGMRAGGL